MSKNTKQSMLARREKQRAQKRKKTFLYLGSDEATGAPSFGVKLKVSGPEVLRLPNARPTGYGLGKSGWVTAHFGPRQKPPVALLRHWIDESYRAVAPKKLASKPFRFSRPPSGM